MATTSPSAVPRDVYQWVFDSFANCNVRITEKLSNAPNLPEESLDLTWIEHFSRYAVPIRLPSGWTVRCETHYLGGMRHFEQWEIADIGVMLFIRQRGQVTRSKVALLQSKRLYPTNELVREERPIDYEVGLARLADPEDPNVVTTAVQFDFNTDCRYSALIADSEQMHAIDEYSSESQISVYYQLYNPWETDWRIVVPTPGYREMNGTPPLGVRIAPAKAIHDLLRSKMPGYRPRLGDLSPSIADYGWKLETFAADLFLGCTEGSLFGSISDANIQRLFYRRSGPIAAAVTLVVDSGEGVG